MGPDRVVVEPPPFDEESGFFEAHKPFLIQAFFPKAAIEAFDVAILGWLTGIYEVQLDLVSLGLDIQWLHSELRSIVNLKQLGLTEPLGDLVQGAYHPFTAQAGVDLNAQAAAGEDIHNVQGTETASVAKPVAGKVHRPHLVDNLWRTRSTSLLAFEPLAMLGAQIELFFFVEAVSPLGIKLPALQTQGTAQHSVTPTFSLLCQFAQTLTQSGIV